MTTKGTTRCVARAGQAPPLRKPEPWSAGSLLVRRAVSWYRRGFGGAIRKKPQNFKIRSSALQRQGYKGEAASRQGAVHKGNGALRMKEKYNGVEVPRGRTAIEYVPPSSGSSTAPALQGKTPLFAQNAKDGAPEKASPARFLVMTKIERADSKAENR